MRDQIVITWIFLMSNRWTWTMLRTCRRRLISASGDSEIWPVTFPRSAESSQHRGVYGVVGAARSLSSRYFRRTLLLQSKKWGVSRHIIHGNKEQPPFSHYLLIRLVVGQVYEYQPLSTFFSATMWTTWILSVIPLLIFLMIRYVSLRLYLRN